MTSLVRYLDGSYLDAGLYWIKIGDKFTSLPLDTIRYCRWIVYIFINALWSFWAFS